MTIREVLVIDTEEADDWIKSLPGHRDEVRIIEEQLKLWKARQKDRHGESETQT